MGFADFPVEVLKALKVKRPEGSNSPGTGQDPTSTGQTSTISLTPESTNSSSGAPSLADDPTGTVRDSGKPIP